VSNNHRTSLSEAAGLFLAELPSEERDASQQEINRFVRWFGGERPLTGLAGAELENYAEQLSLKDTDYSRKLELIKGFLTAAKKEKWSEKNLSVHLKTKKPKAKKQTTKTNSSSKRVSPEKVATTSEGYAKLQAELTDLRGKSLQLIDEIRKAAADKDFRENVPLQAAREQRGHVEGRIQELEAALNAAVIIEEKRQFTARINTGDSVVLLDLDSGEEWHLTLVSPREVDATNGKISCASPVGKAVAGRSEGEVVEVLAPAGKRRCQIKQVHH